MLVIMRTEATKEDVEKVKQRIEEMGLKLQVIYGEKKITIHIIGTADKEEITRIIEPLPGVEKIISILHPFRLASREFYPDDTIVKIDQNEIGGNNFTIIAGPCSVESREQLFEIAEELNNCGVKFLRGGIFKPRTSPYAFQGLEEKGLKLFAEVKEKFGFYIVSEVLSVVDLPLAVQYIDILQIGARNMQNFPLLKAVSKFNKPVLLKRGMMATIEEWLTAAEYILRGGNPNVILCERGIRTFESYTRFTLDLAAIPVVKRFSHLPVIVDPSHAAGDWYYVVPLSKAAKAVGAHGLMVEVHPDPEHALSDGKQSLKLKVFKKLVEELKYINS